MRYASLFAAFAAAFLTIAPPALAQDIPEPTQILGRQLCDIPDGTPLPINTDCMVVVNDANNKPIEKVGASTDAEGNIYLNPDVLIDLYYMGQYPKVDPQMIADHACYYQNTVWSSTISMIKFRGQDESDWHIEITPAMATELCKRFDEDAFTGFFPAIELESLTDNDEKTRIHGPVCFARLKPTPFITDVAVAMFGESVFGQETPPMTLISMLPDGRWFVDMSILEHNGLTEMLIPLDETVSVPLTTLLACQEEDERLGCQNTEASARGGEAGYPFISLVAS